MPQLREVERDRCAPEDFYSTTNHRTYVRHGEQWIEVENQRMDAMIVVRGRPRPLPAAARSAPRRPHRGRAARHSRGAGIEGARPAGLRLHVQRHFVGAPGGDRRAPDRRAGAADALEQRLKVVVVAGPVVVHTGGVAGLAALIRSGFVQALLSGNALGVHDVEAALFGTSLGVRLSDGRQEEHGHRNHMRAINAIYRAGSVAAGGGMRPPALGHALRMREGRRAVRAGRQPARRWPAARYHHRYERRAGRLRRRSCKGAGLVLCLGSMLHSIATGNMLPSWVKIVCVDINPAVATKVSDRGTGQAVGVVADVGLFLDLLSKALSMKRAYTDEHAQSGVDAPAAGNRNLAQSVSPSPTKSRSSCRSSLRVCPKTGLPDFGKIVLRYVPRRRAWS